jgi:Zn-dependent protease
MEPNFLMERAVLLIPLILSLTVHEFAHAWSAWKLGDDTAEREGRLTLNPMDHIDPVGTLLIPLVLALAHAPFSFGWARPVPVNPTRFHRQVNMSTGMMVTAAAGPLSNVLLAMASSVSYGLTLRWAPRFLEANPGLSMLLFQVVVMNVGLALFNMLPVPPLDGSRVVEGLLPYRLRGAWERVLQAGPLLLMATFYFGGRIIDGPADWMVDRLEALIRTLAG